MKGKQPKPSIASPFTILGAPDSANEAELKEAYKRRAVELHPDGQGGDLASFKRLVNAYKAVLAQKTPADREKPGSHWITSTGLLLLLLREGAPEEWKGVLACASDDYLSEVYNLVDGDEVQVQGILSEPWDSSSSSAEVS